MRRSEKAAIVREELQRAFPEPSCPLDHRDPFTLLVAVMLSAQCTDARVNRVTPALFAVAPTPQAMAAMPWQKLRRYIASCGLTETKAKRLVAMSQMLLDGFGGEVPADFAALESLPGVGHKTASVVMSHAFGVPAFPVDTHIFRLARRWALSRGKTVEKVEEDLKKLYPREEWGRLHVQFVLWGRRFCPAHGCKPPCAICSRLALS